MEQSLKTVRQLVENFKANESAYLAPNYSESQVRQDFIDKFFTALGWDVTHTKQFNPYEQEVKIENRVTMPGTQRRADYAFSVAPNFDQVKFFVEAKKPSRSLANADDYFQTIRYAWNTKIPIAVLTDFEEFHILDCRYKPNIKTALERKIGEFRYSEYANEETFAKIFHLFGREAVAAGSLEKYAAALPKKGTKHVGGVQPVDDAFLEELDGYREILAKAFKKTNESLQGDELTEAVQRTIDRLVFIRFLEDKGIEDKQIISISDPKTAWKSFVALCKRFEPKYNGLVFKSHRILDSGEFHAPDGAAVASVFQKISDPSSPYDFNQIPISILGSIYERFLGKVVHATEKRVKVEEKPEVRKAGGVYYTPEYIVRYIVKETVGKLLYIETSPNTASFPNASIGNPSIKSLQKTQKGKTPDEIAQMAFADIACGSGSFLIEVYAQLLDYHLQYYINHPEAVGKDVLFEREGKKYLTLKKKKEILTNNVYGVDIDFQATEVTQLSLYLKMLENATMNDAHQFGLFKETILPDLRQNIICGNSLIGRDILEGELFSNIDEFKLKPMNFEDAFPKIMKKGGFDAVVGNPPYIRMQVMKEWANNEINLYQIKYLSARFGNYDIYVVFIERVLEILNNTGLLGYILPHKFFNAKYGEGIRSIIAKGKYLLQVIHFGDQQIFSNATTYTCLFFLSKTRNDEFMFSQVRNLKEWINNNIKDEGIIKTASLSEAEWNFSFGKQNTLFEKLNKSGIKLGELAEIFVGLQTSADTVFLFKQYRYLDGKTVRVFSKELNIEYDLEADIVKNVVRSGEIGRYWANPNALVLFPYHLINGQAMLLSEKELTKKYPKTWKYLIANKELLSAREHGKFKKTGWYQLYPKNLNLWEQNKILMPYMITTLSAYPDNANLYFVNVTTGGFGLTFKSRAESILFFTGLLNSQLLNWYMKRVSTTFHGGYFAANKQYLVQLPIITKNTTDVEEKKQHDHIVKLVEQLLDSKIKSSAVKTENEAYRLELLCSSLDRKIDEAVYELYGLTEEEIKIVEGK